MKKKSIADTVEMMFMSEHAPGDIVAAVVAIERRSASVSDDSALPKKRGTRLSDDWRPSESDIAYARDRGMSLERIEIEGDKFLYYWTAKAGQGATKRDWSKTWRVWIINAMERPNGFPRNGGAHSAIRPSPTGANAVIAAMGRIARRIDERRTPTGSGNGSSPDNTDSPKQLDFKRGGDR